MRGRGGPGRPPGGFGGPGGSQEPPQPGPKLSPADVKSFPAMRRSTTPGRCAPSSSNSKTPTGKRSWPISTDTDVEVPAKLTVDGKTYPDVGVHFRGIRRS